MHTIRNRLILILILCSFTAIAICGLLVNISIDSTFNKYLKQNQEKRNANIVENLNQIYEKEKSFSKNSGDVLMHDAYMNKYRITLLDSNKNYIWGMNPTDIESGNHNLDNSTEQNGVFSTQTLAIKNNNQIVGYVEIGQYAPIVFSTQDINFKNSINESILISITLSILIAAFISIMVSKQFSKPIKDVAKVSMDLSKGIFNAHSEDKSNIKELVNLTESINILSETLNYQDSLRKRLISDISHEIRTPLNVLQNNLEAMIDNVFPVTVERLTSLNEEVKRFAKLLDNLNTLKEFENEKVLINFQEQNLNDILTSVYMDFNILAKEKNIFMDLDFDSAKNYKILCDYDMIKQVFVNLISNSIKFTSIVKNENGSYDANTIHIKLKKSDEHITVIIKDTGIGINKSDLPFVFERLYRGNSNRYDITQDSIQQVEGSGLGLTIAKKILVSHSASINITSKVNEGTTVTVKFPQI